MSDARRDRATGVIVQAALQMHAAYQEWKTVKDAWFRNPTPGGKPGVVRAESGYWSAAYIIVNDIFGAVAVLKEDGGPESESPDPDSFIASLEALPAPLVFRTIDCPDANGRTPVSGESKWTINFPLEDGRILFIEFGKECREQIENICGQEKRDDKGLPLHTVESLFPRLVRAVGRYVTFARAANPEAVSMSRWSEIHEEGSAVYELAKPLLNDTESR